MSKEYSIVTSAGEYITSVQMSSVTTFEFKRNAKRFTKAEAEKALKMIKAKIDNGATIIPNPYEND